MVQNSSVQIPTVSTVAMFRLLLLLLTFFHSGLCLEIQGVSLSGGGGEYVEMGLKATYVLRCDFRSAYDEQVIKVRWRKFGLPVYTWAINSIPSVFPPLLGQVDVAPESTPHNLHITHIGYSLAGNYTCEVTSTSTSTSSASSTSTSDPFPLYVVDVSAGEYIGTVQLLQSMLNSTNSTDDRDKYEIEGATDSIYFESPECTLVWSLSTPPIFPKPNITCGYFSFDSDDVTYRLSAGLTLHKFRNESWQASFKDTRVQVRDVPIQHRLACTVRIPGTTYKHVIRADDFLVDSLIDAAGCPNLESDESRNLVVDIGPATYTCRGDVLPEDRTGHASATARCAEGHTAVFPDGRAEGGWELSLTCAENDLGWRTIPSDPQNLGLLYNTDDLPHCQPGGVGGGVRWCGSVVVLTTLLLTALLV